MRIRINAGEPNSQNTAQNGNIFWVMIQFKVSILEAGGNMTIWGYQFFFRIYPNLVLMICWDYGPCWNMGVNMFKPLQFP